MVDVFIGWHPGGGDRIDHNKFPGNKSGIDQPGKKFKNRIKQ